MRTEILTDRPSEGAGFEGHAPASPARSRCCAGEPLLLSALLREVLGEMSRDSLLAGRHPADDLSRSLEPAA